MAIEFPSDPTNGDLFGVAGRQFRFVDPPGVWESVGEVDTTNEALSALDGGAAATIYTTVQSFDGGSA